MSLQNLSFDPYILAKLFRQPIIPDISVSTFSTAPPALKYLGKNQKHILIIMEDENNAFCDDASFALLANILHACGLQPADDIAIFNCAHYFSVNWEMLNDFFKPVAVLFFGVENKNIFPVSTAKYELTKFKNIQLIAADNLLILQNDKTLKQQLWKILQTLFFKK